MTNWANPHSRYGKIIRKIPCLFASSPWVNTSVEFRFSRQKFKQKFVVFVFCICTLNCSLLWSVTVCKVSFPAPTPFFSFFLSRFGCVTCIVVWKIIEPTWTDKTYYYGRKEKWPEKVITMFVNIIERATLQSNLSMDGKFSFLQHLRQ